MTICSIAGRVGATYTTGTAAGHGPGDVRALEADPAVGHEHADQRPPPVEVRARGAQAGRARGGDRPAAHAHRRAGRRAPGAAAGQRRGAGARAAVGRRRTWAWRTGSTSREHTLGWDAFRERILEFPPDRVAAITGLPEERIVALGRRLATTRPTAIRCTMGMQRHAGGGNALRLLYALPGVTGDWQYPGGGASYSTSGRFVANVAGVARDDLLRAPVRTLNMTRLGEGLLDLDDPPVQALVVYGANPLGSQPRPGAGARGPRARGPLHGRDRAVPDRHRRLRRHRAAGDDADRAPRRQRRLRAHVRVAQPAGGRAARRVPADHGDVPAARARDGADRAGAVRRRRDAVPHAARRRALRAAVARRLDAASSTRTRSCRSRTASRRRPGELEFFSQRAADDGHDPLPGYTPPALADVRPGAPAGADRARLALVPEHDLRQQAGPRAQARASRASRCIPDDAAARGLADGDEARVFNSRGAFAAVVEVSDRVRPGVVASTKGHWLKNVRGGANVNATVEERDADMGGGAVFHDNRVEVRTFSAGRSGSPRGRRASRSRRTSSSLRSRSATRATASSSSATRSCPSTRTCAGA